MMKKLAILLLFIPLAAITLAQDTYKTISRYDYYTTEEKVEVLVWVPESREGIDIEVEIVYGSKSFVMEKVKAGQLNVLSFDREALPDDVTELRANYYEDEHEVKEELFQLKILADQYNAVKIDRATGGLIVEGLPFYPFGFYAYSPVQPGLAEEEVVKGFNMMSPYQKIEGKTKKERKEYMDRCAALGMKVNYNLLSVAGGGGVGSKDHAELDDDERMKVLREEIEYFKDHPALLSWYISDEPVGQGVPPEDLVDAYELIKEVDPYHPVTVVFMSPWMAKNYSHVMDIVMADPYVVPNGKVEEVGSTAAMLKAEFFLDKPVWIVPQAFGGNEWWEREPTRQEMRAMTYLSLVNGATGIQYFIRHGLNSFPKSTAAWNECGNMALEFAEMTPYLFSPDHVDKIKCEHENILLKGFHKDGAYLIMAVNTTNQPQEYEYTLEDIRYSGSAYVWFENRSVTIKDSKVEDIIEAYGSRVYEVRYKMMTNKGPRLHNKNILKDPSFEDVTGLGIPAACYARPGNDRGATYFIDSRTAIRGTHSLRMTSPDNDGGMSLSFMRQRVEAGRSYTMSIQAKALPLKYREKVKPGFFNRLCGCGPHEEDYPEFNMSLGEGCKEYFLPDGEWREYNYSCIPSVEEGTAMISPVLQLNGKGTVWFDLVQMYPDMEIRSFVNKENNHIAVRIISMHKGTDIFYTIDGSDPGPESNLLKGNFKIDRSTTVRAAAFKEGKQLGYIEKHLVVSYATGRYVEYKNKYSNKYDAGYKDGLVDGNLGSKDFKDGNWQGFEGDDFDVIVNLKEVRDLSRIKLRFLRSESAWIFLPKEIKVLWSADGNEYHAYNVNADHSNLIQSDPDIYTFIFEEEVKARYIRIKALNIGTCPEGHPGEGGKAWIFTDEIIVE